MRRYYFSLLCFAIIYNLATAQTVAPIDSENALLADYTTSWIGNDGGYAESHIPHDMLDMYVSGDGTAATVCDWDEGGSNVAVFRNGRLICRPEGSGTGGWGRFSNVGVVMDDKYVYQLLTQHGCDGGNDNLNVNGMREFPPCSDDIEWKTIRRYDLYTGDGAPFPGGYGYKGDMAVVASERFRKLKGLAIDGNMLYVSISGEGSMPDSVKIYDKRNMSLVSGYPLPVKAGQIYADGKKCLWTVQGNRILRIDAKSGKIKPQHISLPDSVVATTCCVDTRHKSLLVPNHGRDLNILIYEDIYTKPRLAGTFGSRGGVFAKQDGFAQGEVGPLRFIGPRAVGVDAKGNIYIANQTLSNGRGTVLEAYNEAEGRKLWQCEGLIFTATGDFDKENDKIFYTPEKIHVIDSNLSGCRVDRILAYTCDPFTFPSDERSETNGPFVTSCFKRNICGKSFLIVSDMYGSWLGGYRFDHERNGYVGIPSFSFYSGNDKGNDSTRCWVDKNGDGVRVPSEIKSWKEVNPYCMSYFIDDSGSVWRGLREKGIMYWELQGLDDNGNPRFAEPVIWRLPEHFRDAKRVWYDAGRDELFIAGNSDFNADTKDTWWAMGGTIVCCRDFLKKAAENKVSGTWNSDLSVYIPFHAEDGKGSEYTNGKAFTVAGDYIFVVLARKGWITVYRRDNGNFVGRLEPQDVVHRQSGWADFNYAINARENSDGSYEILVEENGFCKVLYYRWSPGQTVCIR